MKKYLSVQFKRAASFFPYLLIITLILLAGLAVVFAAMNSSNSNKEENQKFKIALVGDTDNEFLKIGMGAFKTLDDTRFTLEFEEMSEKDAETALETAEISAYVVMPEDFIEKAFYGEIEPLLFVTSTETTSLTTLFKNEVTLLITDMVISSQKATYGIGDAITDQGLGYDLANHYLNIYALEFFDLVIDRSGMAEVKELGISDGLTMTEYYFCNILLLFVMLTGLPFVCLYCKKDESLTSLLISKGCGVFTQQFCEFCALLVFQVILVAISFLGIGIAGNFISTEAFPMLNAEFLLPFFLHFLPVVVMLSAFNILLFEVSPNVISGILLHFFTTVALSYISGCFYPSYTLPGIVRYIAAPLPVSTARDQMATFITEDTALGKTAVILAYALLFFGVAFAVRKLKTLRHKGGLTDAKSV